MRTLQHDTRWGEQPLRRWYRQRRLSAAGLAEVVGLPGQERHVYNVAVGATLPSQPLVAGLLATYGGGLGQWFTATVATRAQREVGVGAGLCAACGDGPFRGAGGLHLHQTLRHR